MTDDTAPDLPVPTDTPSGDFAAAISDPQRASMRELVAAYVAMGALSDALDGQRKRIKTEVTGRASAVRDTTGADFKAPVGDVGTAGDAHHQAQVVVDDVDACAAWLHEHHEKVWAEAVQHRTEYEVDGGAIADIIHDLRDLALGSSDDEAPALNCRQVGRIADQLDRALGARDVTTVATDALAREFIKAGTKLIDVDGQVVDGVRVIPRRLKWVEIRGDKAYVKGLTRMFERQLLRDPAAAEVGE